MDAAKLASQLEGECQLVVLDSVSSTNDEIVDRVRSGTYSLNLPLFVVSTCQTVGRGRLGRSWLSPLGGIYLSALLSLKTGHTGEDAQASLSPLVAMAVRDALQHFQVGEVRIKWPNDVLSSFGKLAGILIEMKQKSALLCDFPAGQDKPETSDKSLELHEAHEPDEPQFAIIGIGLNVRRPDSGAFEAAGYLDDEFDRYPPLEDVAATTINKLLTYFTKWQREGCSFGSFTTDYLAHMAQIGESVCVRNALGSEIASGLVLGIDDQGRLLLSTAAGNKMLAAGEITLRNP